MRSCRCGSSACRCLNPGCGGFMNSKRTDACVCELPSPSCESGYVREEKVIMSDREPWQQVEGPCNACGRTDCLLVKQWKSESAYQSCLAHTRARLVAAEAAELLVRRLVFCPPWRVERDWTWEVIDANGTTVLKCISQEEADRLVAYVKTVWTDMLAGSRGDGSR